MINQKLINFIEQNKEKYLQEITLKSLKNAFVWWDKYPFNYHKLKLSSSSLARAAMVNTSMPIIVIKDNKKNYILDGMHRLKKLRDIEGKTTVLAYVIPKEDIATFLLK